MPSAAQLRSLQTLYKLCAPRSLDFGGGGDARAERLLWATKATGRKIDCFSDLSDREAGALIDMLKGMVGQTVESPKRWTRPRDRHHARAFAMHGRRDWSGNDEVIASAGDLAAIEQMWRRLGWTREQFSAWLTGPSSPLRPSVATTLRTWSQVNRVRWALKALLKKAGLWKPSAKGGRRAA
jgi:hypothetical protein